MYLNKIRYFRSSDETIVILTFGDDSKQFPFSLPEAFARPAQGPRVDLPPSAAVCFSVVHTSWSLEDTLDVFR